MGTPESDGDLGEEQLGPEFAAEVDPLTEPIGGVEQTSFWFALPRDVALRVLLILQDADACGYLTCVARRHPFLPSEDTFKSICESIYLRQTSKKKLILENWQSWKRMLIYRPRLRTNGFYCLRTIFSKPPSHDAFWEEKRHEFIELKYYRHMRFFNDGLMLYSMDIADPYDMARVLETGVPIPKRVFVGNYCLSGRELAVTVQMHYATMYFKLLVLDGDDGYIGKHNMLTLVEHTALPYTPLPPAGGHMGIDPRIEYQLPLNASLRFYRHPDWVANWGN